MIVKLVNRVPPEDGYFLMKFTRGGGLHLVLIQTEFDGARVIVPENLRTPILIEPHLKVLEDAWFSESSIGTIMS